MVKNEDQGKQPGIFWPYCGIYFTHTTGVSTLKSAAYKGDILSKIDVSDQRPERTQKSPDNV